MGENISGENETFFKLWRLQG